MESSIGFPYKVLGREALTLPIFTFSSPVSKMRFCNIAHGLYTLALESP